MAVKVTKVVDGKQVSSTYDDASSWEVNNGYLTVGTSMGNPTACLAPGRWVEVTKVEEEDPEGDSDED
jgi:hypothetical protein